VELDEYKNVVAQRYAALSDDDKEIIRRFRGSEAGIIIGKVLGPEMQGMLSQLAAPNTSTFVRSRKGLGVR
jgi:hypothetical protein